MHWASSPEPSRLYLAMRTTYPIHNVPMEALTVPRGRTVLSGNDQILGRLRLGHVYIALRHADSTTHNLLHKLTSGWISLYCTDQNAVPDSLNSPTSPLQIHFLFHNCRRHHRNHKATPHNATRIRHRTDDVSIQSR